MKPFQIKDCVLSIRKSDLPPAHNLKELRDRIAVCNEKVLFQHVRGAVLRSDREGSVRGNDFSGWIGRSLGDFELAWRLENIDPYTFPSMEDLRTALLRVIDGRLREPFFHLWAEAGDRFVFVEADLVAYDTGKRIGRPGEVCGAVRKMSCGSIFYHFLEAMIRPPIGVDDLSAWLVESGGKETSIVKALRSALSSVRHPALLRKEILYSLAG